jgi:hypothetical protein
MLEERAKCNPVGFLLCSFIKEVSLSSHSNHVTIYEEKKKKALSHLFKSLSKIETKTKERCIFSKSCRNELHRFSANTYCGSKHYSFPCFVESGVIVAHVHDHATTIQIDSLSLYEEPLYSCANGRRVTHNAIFENIVSFQVRTSIKELVQPVAIDPNTERRIFFIEGIYFLVSIVMASSTNVNTKIIALLGMEYWSEE